MPAIVDAALLPWLLAATALAAVIAALAWLLGRRRRLEDMPLEKAVEPDVVPVVEEVTPPPPPRRRPISVASDTEAEAPPPLLRQRASPFAAAPPAPPAPIAPPPAPARLTLDFRPRRAGLNLLSATVEGVVLVGNDGDLPAEQVRLAAHLIGAHAEQEQELASLRASPIARPVALPFGLAPRERRELPVTLALSHEAMRPLTAAGRPIFVPLVALRLAWATDRGERQLARAFAVGVERPGSAKLAPFWLDQPTRMHDAVAARAQGEPIES